MAPSDDPWLSDEQQHVWRDFLRLTGTLSEYLDRSLRHEAGLPLTYYQVLAMLSEAPHRQLRMAELAAAVWSSPSRMSHAVARLEEAGWVTRRPAPGDGRGQIATLTDAGYATLVAAAPSHARSVRSILFDGLTDEQLSEFSAVCRSALARLTAAQQPLGVCNEDVETAITVTRCEDNYHAV